MVTIGLFTDADLISDGATQTYGPKIRELQQKFPYNLGNGLTIVQKLAGKTLGQQPSFLVRLN
jgi:hypothetical protein